MKAVDPQIQQIYDDIATYQAIALETYEVPAWQALPVASRPDIAFRPSCGQLEGVWVPGGTDWLWNGEHLHSIPNRHNQIEAAPHLQSAGICITGTHAEEVPMVPTSEVFTEFQRQVSGAVAVMPETQANVEQAGTVVQAEAPTAAPAQPGINWGALVPIAVAVIALGLLGRFVAGNQSVKPAQNRNSEPTPQHPEAPTEPISIEQEYDFHL